MGKLQARTSVLDKKEFTRSVLALVIPIALQNLINVAVQSADVIMLGQLDEIALSASSLAGQIQFTMLLIFFGISSGASVLTAQYWGKGDARSIEKVMSIALRLSMGVGLFFALAVTFFPAQCMRIFTPEQAVINEGVRYLRYIAPSYICVSFTNIYLNIMRSVERAYISTVVFLVSLVSNIVLNSIFIYGNLGVPAMGVAGAALATTLARFIELGIVVVYAIKNPILRLRAKDYVRGHKLLLGDFMRYAMPTTLNELVWGMGISANAAVIGRLGAAAVAANSVTQVTRQLATVVSFGVASAAAVLIGKAIGGGQREKARETAYRMMRLAVVAGACGALVVFCLRPLIVNMLSLSAEAKDDLQFQLLVLCAYVICQAFTVCTVVGVFRAGGDTRAGLYLDLATMWGCTIFLGVLGAVVFHWPVKLVLFILLGDEFIKVPIVLLRFRAGRWLENVTR